MDGNELSDAGAVTDPAEEDCPSERATNGGETPPHRASSLTPEQRETLQCAFEAGYFAVPRAVTLDSLAEELGRSDTEVHEQLRRGIATLLRESDLSARSGEGRDGSER